jgi:uncharacterized protein YndB with AHSA1/START domain
LKFGQIKQTVMLDASPAEVYEAYADPKKHSAFTGQGATGKPKVGGKFTAGDEYITGKFLELEKGKKILQEWTTTEWPEGYPPSLLELRIRAKGKRTELTMIHSRVPEEQVKYYAEGWKEWYWGPLKKYFAKG